MFKRKFMKPNSGRCRCSNLKPSDIIEPKPKSSSSSSLGPPDQSLSHPTVPSSSSSSLVKESSTTSSTCSDHDSVCSKLRDSVPILKESKDPFLDFRYSMLEMISEKEIYRKDELQELLDLFLRLNPVFHHQAIIMAFMEILNSVFSSEALNFIERTCMEGTKVISICEVGQKKEKNSRNYISSSGDD